MKKVFLITEFGSPFEWTQQYIDNVQQLGQYGWEWKIFTPNDHQSKGNVEIVKMTPEEYSQLCFKKLGILPNMWKTEKGVPSVHITDFYVASGIIFEDYIKGYDFWGITNMDVVYGRLDRFIPDFSLEQCDVWTDDVARINGVFCLFRNNEVVNNLFKRIPDWKGKFAQSPCFKCLGIEGYGHSLAGTDEYDMTEVMKTAGIRYTFPTYYPLHGHDRLEQHVPEVKLEIQTDGSLWEMSKDVNGPDWIHAIPYMGREIMYFHFQRTKKWPNIKIKQ